MKPTHIQRGKRSREPCFSSPVAGNPINVVLAGCGPWTIQGGSNLEHHQCHVCDLDFWNKKRAGLTYVFSLIRAALPAPQVARRKQPLQVESQANAKDYGMQITS